MTTKLAIYQEVYSYLVNEGIENLDNILKTWTPTVMGKSSGGTGQLVNLLAVLKADIAEESNKANGKGNVAKAMNAVIRRAKKGPRIAYHGAFMVGTRQLVTDEAMMIRLEEPIDLPKAPDGDRIDVLDLFSKVSTAETPLDMPTAAELRTTIKLVKAEGKAKNFLRTPKHWFGGEGNLNLPVVDAERLLDIITAFPDVKGFCESSILKPLYFMSESGEAILCPLNPNTEGF